MMMTNKDLFCYFCLQHFFLAKVNYDKMHLFFSSNVTDERNNCFWFSMIKLNIHRGNAFLINKINSGFDWKVEKENETHGKKI